MDNFPGRGGLDPRPDAPTRTYGEHMAHWRATDRGILTLPSGRTIRGRGLSTDMQPSPDPDFGLYLLASPLDSRPPWDHMWIEWTDFGLPVDPATAREALRSAWQRATDERVEIACLGGLGRTGTALACLAVLDGLSADAAVTLVRDRYDVRAIETPEQAGFVNDFAAAQLDGTEELLHRRASGPGQPR